MKIIWINYLWFKKLLNYVSKTLWIKCNIYCKIIILWNIPICKNFSSTNFDFRYKLSHFLSILTCKKFSMQILIFKDGNTRTFCPNIPILFYVNTFICLKSLRYLSWCITMQDSVLLYVESYTKPEIVAADVRIVDATITSIKVRTIVAVRTAPEVPVVARPWTIGL